MSGKWPRGFDTMLTAFAFLACYGAISLAIDLVKTIIYFIQ